MLVLPTCFALLILCIMHRTFFFFFNDTATTEIYTTDTLFPYTTLFRSLLVLTLVAGPEIKGATRWISLGSLSLQPSEFAKPCFAVVTAWLFSLDHEETGIPGARIAIGLWLVMVSLLLIQPDVGQAVLDRKSVV